MEYDSTFIREIQNMLRIVGRSTGQSALVIPENGILDATTSNALAQFRILYGLPQSELLDEETFAKLLEVYGHELFRRGSTASIRPFPNNEHYELSLGETSELVFILQLMLNALNLYYEQPRIPVNGNYDTTTQNAVEKFQSVNMLPVTGTVDRITWARLAEEYNETVNDSQ